MPMDDRKQRILMAIVSLYAADGEPVGSNLLSRYFDMAVSSATLRNEMAALTRLGLLEQPHTSAGRVPTPKGYRYYVDHLLGTPAGLADADRKELDALFRGLDYDSEKLAEGAAKALADYLELGVVTTTPGAQELAVAHFEVVQVGRHAAVVLAVTAAGGVRTRVAKVEFELDEGDCVRLAQALNRHLRFVARADVTPKLVQNLMDSLGEHGPHSWPVVSAGLTLLDEVGKPSVYFEGQQYFLRWPELEPVLRPLMELFNFPARVEDIIRSTSPRTVVLFGDELAERPIPGICFITRRYLAGGGLSGSIAVVGPARMRFREIIPRLEYFSELLGRGMSGLGA